MRTVTIACSAVLWLVSASEAASQVPRSGSEQLKYEVLPALELVVDQDIGAFVKPYTDCYSKSVVASSASSLKNNETVQRAEYLAQMACKTVKQTSTMKADAALLARSLD